MVFGCWSNSSSVRKGCAGTDSEGGGSHQAEHSVAWL
jgi:hypothetical protein